MQLLSRFSISVLVFCTLLSSKDALATDKTSTCYGTTSQGSLLDGSRLAQLGDNYVVYSRLGWLLGRTYVHSAVFSIILQSYQRLNEQLPNTTFMYAETGWATGGDFAPHKTHQNGLSVDFMVPVVDEAGKSALLPITMNNQFGYAIEFDAKGRFEKYQIDFEALALHLKLLNEAALTQGIGIKRVYFDPRLQIQLFNTSLGEYLKQHLNFNQQQAWVRHDEHYHVDFVVECLPLE